MKTEKCAYAGWKNCYRLSNGEVEVIVTADVGPRIIYFGFSGQRNEFKEFPAMLGKTGGAKWRIYGGHRFWRAPEDLQTTYVPDNRPVQVLAKENLASFIQEPERATGLQKRLDISLVKDTRQVRVVHGLSNQGKKELTLAAWALSVMAPGGMAIAPLPKRAKQLLPTHSLSLWSYTRMDDPRWRWGARYICLKQDHRRNKPQKVGMPVPDAWVGYLNNGHFFLKKFKHLPGVKYPDFGCSVELYTNQAMLEVETLGPLSTLKTGQSLLHQENWFLFETAAKIKTEEDIDRNLGPFIRSAKSQ